MRHHGGTPVFTAHPRAERSPSEATPAEAALSWTRPGSPVALAHPLGLRRVPSLTSRVYVWLPGECVSVVEGGGPFELLHPSVLLGTH